jgi:hypothetical protein
MNVLPNPTLSAMSTPPHSDRIEPARRAAASWNSVSGKVRAGALALALSPANNSFNMSAATSRGDCCTHGMRTLQHRLNGRQHVVGPVP